MTAALVGFVVIGRNEGVRLRRSLAGALAESPLVAYVDSGSDDGSLEHARGRGALVVALAADRPFTAARARNAGVAALLSAEPALRFVQFIDGDCTLAAGWITCALAFMEVNACVAVVCGRRREQHPGESIYNRLCDIEWNTPVGPAKACGGDALMRTAAFKQAGGFRESLIAGEEPELCVRLRGAGWSVHRIDADMTWHDAAMTRFAQWWRRTQRAGHAFAEGFALHGGRPERHCRREVLRPWFWVVGLPLAAAIGVATIGCAALLVLVLYPATLARQALRVPRGSPLRWRLPAFRLAGKMAELQGQLTYLNRRRIGQGASLIEYKR